MQHLRPICLAALICIPLAASASAEDGFSWSYPADSLTVLKEAKTPFVANAAGKISENWTFISSSFEKVGVPTESFQRSMNHNRLLLKAAAAEPDSDFSSILMEDVEDDLSIKANYINNAVLFNPSSYSEVAIEVRTVKKGKEVNGYFVGFSPRHLAGDDPMFRFNNPTSPSSGSLPPGRYEMTAMWNGKIVQRQEVSVGIFGQGSNTVTFLVP
ncbi:hypothetical protein [Mesorhizobium sp. C264A]